MHAVCIAHESATLPTCVSHCQSPCSILIVAACRLWPFCVGEAEPSLSEQARPNTPPHSPPTSTSGRPPTPTPPSHHANGRHEADKLYVNSQGYHVAYTVLLLLRMQQTYLTFQDAVPSLAAEIARRATDLLKVTTCACPVLRP